MHQDEPTSSSPPIQYHLSPEKAEEVLSGGIKFLRSLLGELNPDASAYTMSMVVSSAVGAGLTVATYNKKISSGLRLASGIGVGLAGLYAGSAYLFNRGSVKLNRDLNEINTCLNKIEGDAALKVALLNKLSEHTPHGISPDGKLHYNYHVVGNAILNFSREEGLISERNHLDTLALSFVSKGDDRMVGLLGGLG